jgi:ABC-type enterobactin transport system permease subunit
VRALTHDDGSDAAAIVRDVRVPRLLIGLAVGIALGLAGALMQALTRNPLADPAVVQAMAATQGQDLADRIVDELSGAILAEGPPAEIVTAELVETVFGLPCRIVHDPEAGTPLVIPRGHGVRVP